MKFDVPGWCRWGLGDGRVLLVAPHGGISARDLVEAPPEAGARTNDLHTAELAELLAGSLAGSLVANAARDRNEIDLNRVSEIERRAPWFLDLLAHVLERILARHGTAEVFFVHGWHIVQAKCDLGVGASFARPDHLDEKEGRLTVGAGYVTRRLEPLREAWGRAGIAAVYGERWPARHPNNVMQLFRRGSAPPRSGAAERLATWAREGRVQAVQLELGAPLRWPGTTRAAFVDAFVAEVGGREFEARSMPPAGRAGDRGGAAAPEGNPRRVAGSGGSANAGCGRSAKTAERPDWALQAHDARAGESGLGIIASLGRMPDGHLGGRLLLFPGGQRLAMFTGEEVDGDGLGVGGLTIAPRNGDVLLEFTGPTLLIDDAARHFRCELAQVGASVVPVAARLVFSPLGPTVYGRLAGQVSIGDEEFEIETQGFRAPALAREGVGPGGLRTRIAAAFGPTLGVSASIDDVSGVAGRVFDGTGSPPVEFAMKSSHHPPDRSRPGAAGAELGGFTVPTGDGGEILCRPLNHVSFLRPVGPRHWARITLGVAGFGIAGRPSGSGFYERIAGVAAEPATGDGIA